ncbi:tRNA splicing endonuclease subunit [Aspergillus egyptiacus]|nr:tRNA splicing endonuclease subunit [Aspergillus egyptiacus]
MADLDEDAAKNPSSGGGHIEVDLSDETQDFRMLSNLSNLSFLTDTEELSLPKRGEKDFEPNPTLYQADILSASRQAMHNALSYPRLHNPKNIVVGIYSPNGPAPPLSAKALDTISEDSAPAKAAPASTGVHPDVCVYVTKPKGQLFKTIGQADRWNRVWLLPEEALYLLERGSLDIRWPRCALGNGNEDDIEDSGIPMSLQAAYACFIGHGGLTMERFSVYTGLRRLGYAVIRAPGWSGESGAEGTKGAEQANGSDNMWSLMRKGAGLVGIFTRWMKWLRDSAPTTAVGPVAGLGLHRSYNDIYRKLSLIPFYDPVTSAAQSPRAELPYVVVWHVYKPSPHFRKSAPPTPDFRIAVINARTHTTMPTQSQIGTLLETTPLDAPSPDKSLYMRLRNGYRNVILAVVDQGVVSYLRIADAAFGKEKIYQTQPTRGNKFRGPPRHKFKKR